MDIHVRYLLPRLKLAARQLGAAVAVETCTYVPSRQLIPARPAPPQVQRFLEVSGGADEAAGDALAQQLAEWAADNGQMQALSQMPLPASVEQALLGWLVRGDIWLFAVTDTCIGTLTTS